MANVPIQYTPFIYVQGLTVALKAASTTSLTLSSSWKIPSGMTDGSSSSRATEFKMVVSPSKTPVTSYDDGTLKKGKTVNANTKKPTWTYTTTGVEKSGSVSIPRASYYPLSDIILNDLWVGVCGRNWKGDGLMQTKALYIYQPNVPTITSSFNTGNGRVTFTISAPKQDITHEWRDMRYWVTRKNTAGVNDAYISEKIVVNRNTSSAGATSVTVSYDVQEYQLLQAGRSVTVKCCAYMRGLGGNSGVAIASYSLRAPTKVNISKITVDEGVNGNVNVLFAAPTTSVGISTIKLQRLYNTTIGTVEAAASAQGWEDVEGAVDNYLCSGLVDDKSDATPEVRKHTWYRLVTSYIGLTTEGEPMEAKDLYRARDADSDDAIKWVSVEPSGDAASVELKMGWATDNYTATEIAWADKDDAWESNKQPESFIMDWEDESPSGYDHTARFVIEDLESGVPTYIRARRVKIEDGKVTAKGEWCSPPSYVYPVTPGVSAKSLMLYAPTSIKKGEGLTVTWDYVGEPLKSWRLYKVEDGKLSVLQSGTTSVGKCTVSKNNLPSNLGEFTVRLGVTTGSGTVYSDDCAILLYAVPTLTASCYNTLTAKPLAVGVRSNLPTSTVNMRVICASDIDPGRPDGSGVQLEGDVIWHGSVTPEWGPSGATYVGTIDVDADFLNGGTYWVEACAIDSQTGVEGGLSTDSFEVRWAHPAPEPEATVVVDQNNLSVAITPVEPEDADEEDVCDIYRLSGGRARLVAQDCAFGVPITDTFAPFSHDGSNLAYRVCVRTAEGDTEWDDVPYELVNDELVVDFDGDRLALPWGVAKVESWKKPFSISQRWDGSKPGHWDGGAEHTASLSTYIIEQTDEGVSAKISRLAEHAGPCFVRLADGTAFPANVEVSSYGGPMLSPVSPVSLSATEVDMTNEFMAGTEA